MSPRMAMDVKITNRISGNRVDETVFAFFPDGESNLTWEAGRGFCTWEIVDNKWTPTTLETVDLSGIARAIGRYIACWR